MADHGLTGTHHVDGSECTRLPSCPWSYTAWAQKNMGVIGNLISAGAKPSSNVDANGVPLTGNNLHDLIQQVQNLAGPGPNAQGGHSNMSDTADLHEDQRIVPDCTVRRGDGSEGVVVEVSGTTARVKWHKFGSNWPKGYPTKATRVFVNQLTRIKVDDVTMDDATDIAALFGVVPDDIAASFGIDPSAPAPTQQVQQQNATSSAIDVGMDSTLELMQKLQSQDPTLTLPEAMQKVAQLQAAGLAQPSSGTGPVSGTYQPPKEIDTTGMTLDQIVAATEAALPPPDQWIVSIGYSNDRYDADTTVPSKVVIFDNEDKARKFKDTLVEKVTQSAGSGSATGSGTYLDMDYVSIGITKLTAGTTAEKLAESFLADI